MNFTTISLTPRIGTEIKSDRETLLRGSKAAQIRRLLEERGVLTFRNLELSDEDQVAFARTLGGVQSMGDKYIMKITLDKNENPGAEYLKGSFFWHIDGASDDVPNFAALLGARRLSPTGGQTEFANTYAAYDDLPESEKSALDKLKVVHSFEISQRYVNPLPSYAELKAWQQKAEKVHPLVWKHKSGRKSLMLGSTAAYIEGMSLPEGRALLCRLLEWSTQPQFVYRHEWGVGDLLIWDNTGTMHRVEPYPLESGRLMHRTTLSGEESLA